MVKNLAYGSIVSGDLISYTANANTEKDYLSPLLFGNISGTPVGSLSNRFVIEKITNDGGTWVVEPGYIKQGDFVRLRAYNANISLPVDNPGNPFDFALTIVQYTYPSTPKGWTIGDDWPINWGIPKPIYPLANGTYRVWTNGDALPTGPVMFYGTAGLNMRIEPLLIDENGAWYNIDGTLWTSRLDNDNLLELDEHLNTNDGIAKIKEEIPDYMSTLNEYYFAFVSNDGYNLLEITSTRRENEGFVALSTEIK